MSLLTSLRDVGLIAQFEFLRAVRTWRALALLVLYAVATIGAVMIFSQVVLVAEEGIASTIGAVPPERPGLMLDQLMQSENTVRFLTRLGGSESVAAELVRYSPLALFHLWFSLLLAPFFAATSSAESIAVDVQSRAIRYEVLRTGRSEVVFGRFAGQALLVGAATALGVMATWSVGALYFVGQDLPRLALQLSWVSLRAWAFALPFVALGVLCSTVTSSPAWARVLAVAAACGSWVLWAVAHHYRKRDWGMAMDLVLDVLPQGWVGEMWAFDGGWVAAAGVCVVLSVVLTGLGSLRFEGRDL